MGLVSFYINPIKNKISAVHLGTYIYIYINPNDPDHSRVRDMCFHGFEGAIPRPIEGFHLEKTATVGPDVFGVCLYKP